MKKRKRIKKNTFVLDTDWVFSEPIDFEHKKYILLSYFQKLDKLFEENKLYPTFVELSLHLASLQTLIKEGVILYTNKEFENLDDELLLKDLLVKTPPKFSTEDLVELEKIVKFAAPKFFEYFNIAKSYWSICYDSVSLSIRKNKKNISQGYGFITFTTKDKVQYFWEYEIIPIPENKDDYKINFKLIYSEKKTNLTNQQILDNFSTLDKDKIMKAPIFIMKSENEFPMLETLLPIFKRKVLSYVFQVTKIENIKQS